ncbi:methionyl-tRNA formyltransferase [Spiroplasma platyhelix]|uniref:Methionyl-tRNA formyltransferase n=1 Tax=Spiroplasma platyhelix PALS-1 TaxID=1276218 RepID=A0A846TX30_9MOLU|nr:methionyl-tRNA formyltransferase [Spiroplasma platyhelix]MBE4704380.1 Methionyl-tRNA formyltransferase [Spiroplasma platyhelix PALS-1]NKE38752.1 methionyl-tRNA formyltransferase [Spiroplasma platyhelix PALS-1]UJB28963.1 methionyl-tRNA formyltransferase [Spiroplasma platyhelix PALS-1]
MVEKVNVLFMGTTIFAKEILTSLLAMKEVNIVGVVCQPDRKIGRKQEIVFSPVKQLALAKAIKLFQPEKISSEYDNLKALAIDVIVTCAYGQFLPSKVLELAKILPLNIHASLLPKLRGGAPIQWAIINNFSETGITLMKMSPKMDAGDIFSQEQIKITSEETYSSLEVKLIALAKQMIEKDLIKIINGQILVKQQNENEVTFGLNITREDELINWDQNAVLVSCKVRGLYDHPIAYTTMNNFIYKIHQVVVSEQKSQKQPGTITLINNLGIFVATKDYDVVLKQIQAAGKKVISASSYFGSSTNPLKVDLVFN